MSKLKDSELQTYADFGEWEHTREMARELLDRRANESGWSIELGAMRLGLKQVTEQLAAAERVVEAARFSCCVLGEDIYNSSDYVSTYWHENLDEALEAYDKVIAAKQDTNEVKGD